MGLITIHDAASPAELKAVIKTMTWADLNEVGKQLEMWRLSASDRSSRPFTAEHLSEWAESDDDYS